MRRFITNQHPIHAGDHRMRVGIIGSGIVGQQLGIGFAKSGHEVMIGTREPGKLTEWTKQAGPRATVGSNSEAAAFGEIIVFCTKWDGAENAIMLAGKENFNEKIVIDTTNPLHSTGPNQAPVPSMVYPHSSGKKMQEWLPNAHVVKCFNIISSYAMHQPHHEEGDPDLFLCGNDENAKKKVEKIARAWGWKNVHDIGDISQSYLLENLAMLWIVFGYRNNHWTHAFKLLKK